MSIEINDVWVIEPTSQCFKLKEEVEYETEDGEIETRYNKTYHKTVLQALRYIRREESKECEKVEELIEHWKESYELDKQQVLETVEERDELNPYLTLSEEAQSDA